MWALPLLKSSDPLFQAPPFLTQRRFGDLPLFSISSAQNHHYKAWRSLLDGRGIKKQQEALVFGLKIIREILQMFSHRAKGLILRHPDELNALMGAPLPAPETGFTIFQLAPELFTPLDIYGINGPLLLISAPPLPTWNEALPQGLTLFLPFQNPINLGTTIRSAAALGAPVVLLKEAASPYLPKSLRASGPALFQTSLLQGPTLEELSRHSRRLPLYALSPAGRNIFQFDFPPDCGLVAGMEGPGLTGEWPEEQCLSIPMRAGVESLNAAMAVSMALGCYLARTT